MLRIVATVFVIAFSIGCGKFEPGKETSTAAPVAKTSAKDKKWKNVTEITSHVKGKNKTEITSEFGEPDNISRSNDGSFGYFYKLNVGNTSYSVFIQFSHTGIVEEAR